MDVSNSFPSVSQEDSSSLHRVSSKTSRNEFNDIIRSNPLLDNIPSDLHSIIFSRISSTPFEIKNKCDSLLLLDKYNSVISRYADVDTSQLSPPPQDCLKCMMTDFFNGVPLLDIEILLLAKFVDFNFLDSMFGFGKIDIENTIAAIRKNYATSSVASNSEPYFFQWLYRTSRVAPSEGFQNRAITVNSVNFSSFTSKFNHFRLNYEIGKNYSCEIAENEILSSSTLLPLLLELSSKANFKLSRMCQEGNQGTSICFDPFNLSDPQEDRRLRQKAIFERYASVIK